MTNPHELNLEGYIRDRVQQEQYDDVLGVVTDVIEHDQPSDFSNHEVNVSLVNENEEFRRIPVHTTRTDSVYVPEQGDFVEVSFLGSETQAPYVSGFAHSSENRAPLARSGHWRHRFGENSPYLFLEAETSDHSSGEPDIVRIGTKSDGLSDPDEMIEFDASEQESDVTVQTTGVVTIQDDDGGSLTIDAGDLTADGASVVLGQGGTDLLKDVTVQTTTDTDGHVTSVSLTKDRSSVVETE